VQIMASSFGEKSLSMEHWQMVKELERLRKHVTLINKERKLKSWHVVLCIVLGCKSRLESATSVILSMFCDESIHD
jgi:hypothetical protein